MININTYILEKLRIDRNTKFKSPRKFTLNKPYLIVNKLINGEVYISNIIILIGIDDNNHELKIATLNDPRNTYKYNYCIYNNHIICSLDKEKTEEEILSSDEEKFLLLSKDEAIYFLNNLKKNNYKINRSLFDKDCDKDVDVFSQSKHKITDNDISQTIDLLNFIY